MVPARFRVAMLNTLRLGPYSAPHLTGNPRNEWLIVERSGPEDAVLTVSDTQSITGESGDVAPDDLTPRNTIVALFAEPNETRGAGPRFLIVRHAPLAIPIPGTFFPADGYAELGGVDGSLDLIAFGRHAHSQGAIGERPILRDIPEPAPSAIGAINWHFNAEQRPWSAQT